MRPPAGLRNLLFCQCHQGRSSVRMQVLNGIINASSVPFSSYVPYPRTPLHFVDARLKQLWLVALLILVPRVPWQARLALVAAVLALTLACLPARLAKAQLMRLVPLALLVAAGTALSDQVVTAPAPSASSPALLDAPSLEGLNTGYKYVLFHFAFITVSRFSLSLGVSIGSTLFCALQLTSLFLLTTPPEQMALAFRWFIAPLKAVGVPVERLTFTLLLSLRFVSLVFDEVRNLCFGLASRAMPWAELQRGEALRVWVVLIDKAFSNLFARSRFIAESLRARGVVDASAQHLNVPRLLKSNALANVATLVALAAIAVLAAQHSVALRMAST